MMFCVLWERKVYLRTRREDLFQANLSNSHIKYACTVQSFCLFWGTQNPSADKLTQKQRRIKGRKRHTWRENRSRVEHIYRLIARLQDKSIQQAAKKMLMYSVQWPQTTPVKQLRDTHGVTHMQKKAEQQSLAEREADEEEEERPVTEYSQVSESYVCHKVGRSASFVSLLLRAREWTDASPSFSHPISPLPLVLSHTPYSRPPLFIWLVLTPPPRPPPSPTLSLSHSLHPSLLPAQVSTQSQTMLLD